MIYARKEIGNGGGDATQINFQDFSTIDHGSLQELLEELSTGGSFIVILSCTIKLSSKGGV